MGEMGKVQIASFSYSRGAQPIYAIGEAEPISFIDQLPYEVSLNLLVWDEEFISNLVRSRALGDGSLDSLFGEDVLFRPCCRYCGTPINVSERAVKCASCGAPLTA